MAEMIEWVLMQRAQIDGAVREGGYIFWRPDDWNPGGTTVRGDGPIGSPEEFKLEPLAIKRAELPKPAPSDGPPPGHNMPAEIETTRHDDGTAEDEREPDLIAEKDRPIEATPSGATPAHPEPFDAGPVVAPQPNPPPAPATPDPNAPKAP